MANDVQSHLEPIVPTLGGGIPAATVSSPPERSATTLVTGIIADVQHLIEQQFAMFRQELRDNLRKSKEAALSLTVGVGLVQAGGMLALLMLALLLHEAVPVLPLWACYGIPGGILVALGCVLIRAGIRKFESFNPPSDQAAEAFKDTIQWKTKPT